MAYVISRDVSSFKTVFRSGRKHGCGWLAAARQAWPGGAALSAFGGGGHPSVQPLPLRALGTGPPFQQAPPGTSWVQQGRRGREELLQLGERSKREENAKKMWSVGEKTQKGQKGRRL